jgi:hypothetical protein
MTYEEVPEEWQEWLEMTPPGQIMFGKHNV